MRRTTTVILVGTCALLGCLVVVWKSGAGRQDAPTAAPSIAKIDVAAVGPHLEVPPPATDPIPRLSVETGLEADAMPEIGSATLSPDQAVREFRRINVDTWIKKFSEDPGKVNASGALMAAIPAILDAAGLFVTIPEGGTISDSRTDPVLPPGMECWTQILSIDITRKYTFARSDFPLYWEIDKCLPEFITGLPELSPAQIQAVKDQLEIARQLLQ